MDSVGYIAIVAGVAIVFIAYKFLTKKEVVVEKQVIAKEKPV
jgi:hypothetical protein